MLNPVKDRKTKRLQQWAKALRANKTLRRLLTSTSLELELPPEPDGPALVQETMQILGISRRHFAQFLGARPNSVSRWEKGQKTPNKTAKRLMSEIRLDPEYWRGRVARALKLSAKPAPLSGPDSLPTTELTWLERNKNSHHLIH